MNDPTFRRRSCEVKKKYRSVRQVRYALTKLLFHEINKRDGSAFRLHYYPCDFCGKFHIGHKPTEDE